MPRSLEAELGSPTRSLFENISGLPLSSLSIEANNNCIASPITRVSLHSYPELGRLRAELPYRNVYRGGDSYCPATWPSIRAMYDVGSGQCTFLDLIVFMNISFLHIAITFLSWCVDQGRVGQDIGG